MSDFLNLPPRRRKNEKWFVNSSFPFSLRAAKTCIFLQIRFGNHTLMSYTWIYNSNSPLHSPLHPVMTLKRRQWQWLLDQILRAEWFSELPQQSLYFTVCPHPTHPESLSQISPVLSSATQPVSNPKGFASHGPCSFSLDCFVCCILHVFIFDINSIP